MIYITYVLSIYIGLWLFSLIYNRFYEKKERFLLYQVGYLVVSAAAICTAYLGPWNNLKIGWLIVWSFVFVVLWINGLISYKLRPSAAFLVTAWVIITWQFLVEGILVLANYLNITFAYLETYQDPIIVPVVLFAIIIAAVYAFAYFVISVGVNKNMPYSLGPRQIIVTTLIFAMFEIMSVTFSWPFDITINGEWQKIYLIQLAGSVTFFLECEMFKNSLIRKEYENLQLLFGAHEEQYHLRKVNIDLINQKCHDLKHQVRALRTAQPEEIEKYLTEIEDSIDIYEHIVNTGNDVLDTILTDKSLYCRKHDISISCVVDGSRLAFINSLDLYAIFGNAIDNAIEAVNKIRNHDSRTIDIMVYMKNDFLVINIFNPMAEKLHFDDGFEEGQLPATTKNNKHQHGFGLKSIKYIAEKYDGVVSISTEDNCFSLKILFPVQQNAST